MAARTDSQVLIDHFKLDNIDVNGDASRSANTWVRNKQLGHGAFGTVWLEKHNFDGRTRAVKEIKHRANASRDRFSREIVAMSRLSTPHYGEHFAQFLGWYEDASSIFLAMEYFELGDLRQHILLDDTGTQIPLPESECRTIIQQLLEGLAVMHQDGYVHRDLKPDNVFVLRGAPGWRVKIRDLGIGTRIGEDGMLHSTARTLFYMAPELLGLMNGVCSDGGGYTNLVDIWSLGIIFYELRTGKLPFEGESDLRKYRVGQPDILFELAHSGTSEHGRHIIEEMLSLDPVLRPSAEMILERWFPAEETTKSDPGSRAGMPNIPEKSEIVDIVSDHLLPPSGSLPCYDLPGVPERVSSSVLTASLDNRSSDRTIHSERYLQQNQTKNSKRTSNTEVSVFSPVTPPEKNNETQLLRTQNGPPANPDHVSSRSHFSGLPERLLSTVLPARPHAHQASRLKQPLRQSWAPIPTTLSYAKSSTSSSANPSEESRGISLSNSEDSTNAISTHGSASEGRNLDKSSPLRHVISSEEKKDAWPDHLLDPSAHYSRLSRVQADVDSIFASVVGFVYEIQEATENDDLNRHDRRPFRCDDSWPAEVSHIVYAKQLMPAVFKAYCYLRECGFCDGEFSIIVYDKTSLHIDQPVLRIVPIQGSVIGLLHDAIENALLEAYQDSTNPAGRQKRNPHSSVLPMVSHVFEYLGLASDIKKGVDKRDVAALVHILALGLISYSRSHLRLDSDTFRVLQNGVSIRLTSGSITFDECKTSCLDDYIIDNVWAFSIEQPDDDRLQRLDVLTSLRSLADIWGPLTVVDSTTDEGMICSIRTERGMILATSGYQIGRPVYCHWYSRNDRMPENIHPFPQDSMLIIGCSNDGQTDSSTSGASTSLKSAGTHDELTTNLTCKRMLHDTGRMLRLDGHSTSLGTCKPGWDLDGINITGGVSRYVTSSATVLLKRRRGVSRKAVLCLSWESDVPPVDTLDIRSVVEISACTGNARRISLLEVLSLNNVQCFLESNCQESTTWKRRVFLTARHGFKAFKSEWSTSEAFRDVATTIIRRVIRMLEQTKPGGEEKALRAWFPDVEPNGFVFKHLYRHKWSRLLNNSHEDIAMVIFSSNCLEKSRGQPCDGEISSYSPHNTGLRTMLERVSYEKRRFQTFRSDYAPKVPALRPEGVAESDKNLSLQTDLLRKLQATSLSSARSPARPAILSSSTQPIQIATEVSHTGPARNLSLQANPLRKLQATFLSLTKRAARPSIIISSNQSIQTATETSHAGPASPSTTSLPDAVTRTLTEHPEQSGLDRGHAASTDSRIEGSIHHDDGCSLLKVNNIVQSEGKVHSIKINHRVFPEPFSSSGWVNYHEFVRGQRDKLDLKDVVEAWVT